MQFTKVLAIAAIAAGSASVVAFSPSDGCISIDGVQFCTNDESAPSPALSFGGCITIDFVQFCTVYENGTEPCISIDGVKFCTIEGPDSDGCISIDSVEFCNNGTVPVQSS
ncbi:hypothetical protein D9619_013535 [Psilocybe cf. subviscida]|uniref:Extracellular membrane protein CFEM domain-containing protein n=1 Tax=Psilocybe cf. subviscida TaxID=2480587 RepID=A0A8H5BJI0_9AGAR|nr:hypothetical protein D9619_013535 [Psilocybe cf. subviscida]